VELGKQLITVFTAAVVFFILPYDNTQAFCLLKLKNLLFNNKMFTMIKAAVQAV
jgi:hypothetical protein